MFGKKSLLISFQKRCIKPLDALDALKALILLNLCIKCIKCILKRINANIVYYYYLDLLIKGRAYRFIYYYVSS